MNRIEKQQDVLKRYHFKKVSENENEILYEKPIPIDVIDAMDDFVGVRVCLYKDYEKKKKVNPKATSYTLYYPLNDYRALRNYGLDIGKIDRLIGTLLLQLGAIEDESI